MRGFGTYVSQMPPGAFPQFSISVPGATTTVDEGSVRLA
jgi:hypothetical protein